MSKARFRTSQLSCFSQPGTLGINQFKKLCGGLESKMPFANHKPHFNSDTSESNKHSVISATTSSVNGIRAISATLTPMESAVASFARAINRSLAVLDIV